MCTECESCWETKVASLSPHCSCTVVEPIYLNLVAYMPPEIHTCFYVDMHICSLGPKIWSLSRWRLGSKTGLMIFTWLSSRGTSFDVSISPAGPLILVLCSYARTTISPAGPLILVLCSYAHATRSRSYEKLRKSTLISCETFLVPMKIRFMVFSWGFLR